MQCPLCIESVLEPRFHGTVEVDVCPRCKGVWLDRDELQKLVDIGESAPPPPKPSGTATSGDHDDRERVEQRSSKGDKKKQKKRRKKSLGERLGDVLEDVLDFDFD